MQSTFVPVSSRDESLTPGPVFLLRTTVHPTRPGCGRPVLQNGGAARFMQLAAYFVAGSGRVMTGRGCCWQGAPLANSLRISSRRFVAFRLGTKVCCGRWCGWPGRPAAGANTARSRQPTADSGRRDPAPDRPANRPRSAVGAPKRCLCPVGRPRCFAGRRFDSGRFRGVGGESPGLRAHDFPHHAFRDGQDRHWRATSGFVAGCAPEALKHGCGSTRGRCCVSVSERGDIRRAPASSRTDSARMLEKRRKPGLSQMSF